MKIDFIFEPRDLWIGFFYDKKKKWLYFLPVPTLGIILKFRVKIDKYYNMAITKKIQTKNAIKWLEALLSGKYKQGRDNLGNDEMGYCCWGVGCKVTKINFNSHDGWNDNLYKKIGFNSINGCITPKLYSRNSLMDVNDQSKAGFKRIAKHLIKYADRNFEKHVAIGIKEHFKK